MSHPYKSAPARSFWSRAVSAGFDARQVIDRGEPLIRPGEAVASAGSCFASNIVPYLEKAGLQYLRTEGRNPALPDVPPENLGYQNFSAAYGNIYTPRQLLQLLRRSLGSFSPIEDRWHVPQGVIDPFRPALRYHALSDREFDLLTAQHLAAVRRMFEEVRVFVFTLGLTEAWVSRLDGAVFPACPGTVAGTFDAQRHAFVNFSVDDITTDLDSFVRELRAVNPSVRIVLTVSPVPLVATATGRHVLTASTYSKSVLRVAANEIEHRHPAVTYFPSYEIVTGPQAPEAYLEPDRHNVSREAVAAVMAAFLDACETSDVADRVPTSLDRETDAARRLSASLVKAECEEAMADPGAAPVTGAVAESTIRRLHETLLARAPTEAELKRWADESKDVPVLDLVAMFVATHEFKNRLKG